MEVRDPAARVAVVVAAAGSMVGIPTITGTPSGPTSTVLPLAVESMAGNALVTRGVILTTDVTAVPLLTTFSSRRLFAGIAGAAAPFATGVAVMTPASEISR